MRWGSVMPNLADMTVYDVHGQLTMIIEVKNKLDASQEWAAKMRRNILSYGVLPPQKGEGGINPWSYTNPAVHLPVPVKIS